MFLRNKALNRTAANIYLSNPGAMGSFFGGLLAEKGLDVVLIDVWQVGQAYLGFQYANSLRIRFKLNTALLSTVRVSVRVFVRHRRDISHFSHI